MESSFTETWFEGIFRENDFNKGETRKHHEFGEKDDLEDKDDVSSDECGSSDNESDLLVDKNIILNELEVHISEFISVVN